MKPKPNRNHEPLYTVPRRAIPASLPRQVSRPVTLVEKYRTIIDGIAVGSPTKVVATGPNLEAAQASMIRKLKLAHQTATRELYKLNQKVLLLQSATGLGLPETDFSERLASCVLDEGTRETVAFLAKARPRFPQSEYNLQIMIEAFLAKREGSPDYVFSAEHLLEIYRDAIDSGRIQPTLQDERTS